MKKATIEVNPASKVMKVSVAGKMTMEDSKAFVSEYNTKTNAINPSDFTLEVNCLNMPVVTQDMTEELTNVMGLYKSTGFKQVVFQIKSNSTLKMQLSRLARNAGLTNATVVDIG